jgi:hypothetical protein
METAVVGLELSALDRRITDCAGFGYEWLVKGFNYRHLGFEGRGDVYRILRSNAMVPHKVLCEFGCRAGHISDSDERPPEKQPYDLCPVLSPLSPNSWHILR